MGLPEARNNGGKIELDSSNYDEVRRDWLEPLILWNLFDIPDRSKIIKTLFPVSSPLNDSKYYRWMWHIKPHWCENCGKPLKEFSPVYISHILTRGAHTELRYEPLNCNILCYECHNKWEYSTRDEKKSMYIYWINKTRFG